MAAFITHPTVRVKGSEHNYNPVLCQDEKCSASQKGSHMHCPFCSITEAYQDPVILRAHYRIKHVDKGLDFAGLKILRCCNHCDIVGTIKGEKKFKGAHWHCYRCRNGFNRRDEAVKHYKTHFRNPHTTFQIQITQEVNNRQYYEQSGEAQHKAYGGSQVTSGGAMDITSISPVLTETVITTSTTTLTTEKTDIARQAGKDSSLPNGITVAAEETVGSSSAVGHQTLVLMDPDGENGELVFNDATALVTDQNGEDLDQNLLMEKQLMELHQQNQQLRAEKSETESKLRSEILQLKDQIADLTQANLQIAEELKQYKSSESTENKVKQMIEQMEVQHREMLQMQVEALRKEFSQTKEQTDSSPGYSTQDSAANCGDRTDSRNKRTLVATSTLSPRSGSITLTIPTSIMTTAHGIMTSEHGIMTSPEDMIAGSEMDLSSGSVISFIQPTDGSSNGPTGLTTLEIVEVHLDSDSAIESSAPTHVQLFPVAEISEDVPTGKRTAHVDSEEDSPQKIQRTD
ncbi:uncharacterized protein zgc:193801 isoform X1 [Callorhinchus milii]|uniref:uncharacterized protein zgc:193801 isoform X1 n=2 Tax=Callorhinchus milii TaxID=7868 RepID=UPI001C3F9718|nr:uncharacterized protein zgc:193801 isoform X1 [Callorhinchus milii]